jgi:hypothetical protein
MNDDFSEGNDRTLKHEGILTNEERGKILSFKMRASGLGDSKKIKVRKNKTKSAHHSQTPKEVNSIKEKNKQEWKRIAESSREPSSEVSS